MRISTYTSNIMSNSFWEAYWADKANGEHRSQDETFLEKEAKEKLFHLAGGESLLDFGCGSADLLAYYAPFYRQCAGADRSASMLANARKRLASRGFDDKVTLLLADDNRIWEVLDERFGEGCKFDRITAGQVIQYFDEQQINSFLSAALSRLSVNGKICLFDVIDSRTLELWQAGLFGQDKLKTSLLWKLYIRKLHHIKNRIQGKPKHSFGNVYPPSLFTGFARRHGLNILIVHSMYYEYRYHVILSRENP